jgi:hypothetical protein
VTLLGAWVFFAPLVGPYFSYGFFTGSAWHFSSLHWMLLLGPGLVAGISGLVMFLPSRLAGWSGSIGALLAGVWLIVGPTLHALWSSKIVPITAVEPDAALRWIGYFYGPGILLVFLSAWTQGLLALAPRRRPPEPEPAVVAEEDAGEAPLEEPSLAPSATPPES